MKKDKADIDFLVQKLSDLSDQLTKNDHEGEVFNSVLNIIIETMRFNIAVIYEVSNQIDNILLLNVVSVFDPHGVRNSLTKGKKIKIHLGNPAEIYINECEAYSKQTISTINVPGIGCDIMGYIQNPNNENNALLIGGDFVGDDAQLTQSEIDVFKIINNLLTLLFFRNHFETQAIYDGLTKLYNSQKIKAELEIFLKRKERQKNQPLSIVLADIDYFKKINDEYSHIQGDSVLEEIGQILSHELREDVDSVGRYGGEEFMFILFNADGKEAFQLCERIRTKIENYQFLRIDESGLSKKNESLSITMSFGIATIISDVNIKDSKELIALADKALYTAKNQGRNKSIQLDFN